MARRKITCDLIDGTTGELIAVPGMDLNSDVIYRLQRQFGVSDAHLDAICNVQDTVYIKPGDVLCISYYDGEEI